MKAAWGFVSLARKNLSSSVYFVICIHLPARKKRKTQGVILLKRCSFKTKPFPMVESSFGGVKQNCFLVCIYRSCFKALPLVTGVLRPQVARSRLTGVPSVPSCESVLQTPLGKLHTVSGTSWGTDAAGREKCWSGCEQRGLFTRFQDLRWNEKAISKRLWPSEFPASYPATPGRITQ